MDRDVIMRREKPEEYRTVEELVRDCFWNVYRPGCEEHFVLKKLREDPDFVPELDFVMEREGRIVGQNMFMRTSLALDDGTELPILTMGPICVARNLQRQGYGKRLLDHSLEAAASLGYGAVFFEGNIEFYGKSGFTVASSRNVRYHGLPEDADAGFFLCRELRAGYLDGISGEYATPSGYFAAHTDPEGFRIYDATFPVREKLRLPGQLDE